MAKNNVIRMLESKRIHFQAFVFPAVKMGAMETATILQVDPALVYKTILVLRERGKPILAVIPGGHRVDLKLMATALGEKKLSMSTEREAEDMTGLQAGGISPLALINKGFQVALSAEAKLHVEIHISGGERGLNIKIPVKDLVALTNARIMSISIPDE